ncbi:diguanylate cyclase [Nakamurella sp. YIM 132087]|uniref:Diguanylate cyclase n=1 Tax=Nakamurella alba TaxID=2665158 RepID=A0A7K1FQA7_9ACTN|nr:GGDEF domain-containing protein [Nakamurella alba]MTD15539.1 diguanylate cyclase [Nakamurella alba]
MSAPVKPTRSAVWRQETSVHGLPQVILGSLVPSGDTKRQEPGAWKVLGLLHTLSGLIGVINGLVPGSVRTDGFRWVYIACVAASFVIAGLMFVRRRAGHLMVLVIINLSFVLYIFISISSSQPRISASPLLMMFPILAAAWYLKGTALVPPVVLVTLGIWLAIRGQDLSPVQTVIQVGVRVGILVTVMLVIAFLVRRIRGLLEVASQHAQIDPLTALYNRRGMLDRAPALFAGAAMTGDRVAAILLDLDHFKKVNDNHGHDVGDAVLRRVAATLSTRTRRTDLIIRTGGEELLVLAPVRTVRQAAEGAERLRQEIVTSCARQFPELAVTVSAGVSSMEARILVDPEAELGELVREADQALYLAKTGGRNQVREFAGSAAGAA